MKQARYFVKPEEKPVIEDFKARVNVYGTEEEGGRVFLAAVAIGDTEEEARERARNIVELKEREAWARRRIPEIDTILEALGKGVDDALDAVKADRGRDMSQAFPDKPKGELKMMQTRNELMATGNLTDRLENYRRTVSRLRAERETLYRLTGEGE